MVLVDRLTQLESPSDFYGRDKEVDLFKGFLDSNRSIIYVRGDPGSGKTTLTDYVLNNHGKRRVVSTEVESSHRWSPSRIYANVVMDLLDNPTNPDEFRARLRDWYGEGSDRNDDSTQLLVAAVYHHNRFGEYDEAANFTAERREQGFGQALADFFAGGRYKTPVTVQISNYEREALGDRSVADDILTTIAGAVEDKPISFVVETRADLEISPHRIDVDPIPEYPTETQYRSLVGEPDHEIIEHIDRVAGGRPYATVLGILAGDKVKGLGNDASLEDILDLSVADLPDDERRLLQLVAHSQGPMSLEDVANAVGQLGIGDDEAYDGFTSLIDRKLISTYDGRIGMTNPRAGERVSTNPNHTSPEDSQLLNSILLGLSDNDMDRFHYACGARDPLRTYETANNLFGKAPNSVDIAYAAVDVIDEVNATEDKGLSRMTIDLLYKAAQQSLNSGRYGLRATREDIAVIREDHDHDDPGLAWREHSVGLVDELSDRNYERAAQYLELMRRSAGAGEEFIAAGGVHPDEQEMLRGLPRKVIHLGAFLNTDRVCFDDRAQLDDAGRIALLRESDRALRDQLATEDNLGYWDRIMLSYIQSTWAMFDPAELGLLDRSYENIQLALSDPKLDVHNRFSALANRAQVLMLQDKLDEAVDSLKEAEVLHARYSHNDRNKLNLLVIGRDIAKKRGDLTSEFSSEITDLLTRTSPPDFFNYRHLTNLHDRLLSS